MEIDPASLQWTSMYKILTGCVLPRPIGWISTANRQGRANLAPFSFFTVVCPNPPTVLFCPLTRALDGASKDTLNNLRASGEFVVSLVTEALAEAMVRTSVEAPAELDEFEYAGLEKLPSVAVKPPRVAGSPVHFECRLEHLLEVGDGPGSGNIVVGRIIHVHIADHVLQGADRIDLAALKPVGRLAGSAYARVTDVFEIERPKPLLTPRDQGGPS